MFYKVLYRDPLFYAVYAFVKWEMIRGNGFMATYSFIFVSPNLVVAFTQTFWCSLNELFESNRRLAKVRSHSVYEKRLN